MKCALITGASEGLGEALALLLAKEGMSLILVARNEAKLKALALKIGPSTQILVCDLCDTQNRQELISLIHSTPPDLIINNAGCGLYGPALSHSTPESMQMIELNIRALAEISLEGAKALHQRGKKGIILNISSAAAFYPYPTFCIYAATKAFVNLFSQGFDQEMKPYGIRILTVCPGQIKTRFRTKAAKGKDQTADHFTMSAERAATLILKQIRRAIPFRIIDTKYALGIYLSKFFPKSFIIKLLQKSLRRRYTEKT